MEIKRQKKVDVQVGCGPRKASAANMAKGKVGAMPIAAMNALKP